MSTPPNSSIIGRPRNGAAAATATHCRNGHAWTDETAANTTQGRKCRLCMVEATRRQRAKEQATPAVPEPPSIDKLRRWADLCRSEYRVGQGHVRTGSKELADLLQYAYDALLPTLTTAPHEAPTH